MNDIPELFLAYQIRYFVIQLYNGSQLFWWRNPANPEKKTEPPEVA
jgi:hypothetical protein